MKAGWLALAKTGLWIGVLLAPLCLLLVHPPVAAGINQSTARIAAIAFLYSLYACFFGGSWLAQQYPRLGIIIAPSSLLIGTILIFLRHSISGSLPGAVLLAFLSCLLIGVYARLESQVPAPGLISLVLFLITLGSLEVVIRACPERIVSHALIKVPALAPPDRGNQALETLGFRGRQPCTDCATRPIRIVTMGGSSTYGIPLPSAAQTFSNQLQRILDREYPQQQFEVLNAGIAGYGIVQVLDSLEKYVLKFQPDIVIVNSWFNDSARSTGWYGYVGLSDREAQDRVELLRKVQALRLYRFASGSSLYAICRYYLGELLPAPKKHISSRAQRRRMDPDEFQKELARFADLASRHKFIPVLLYEVTNRQEPLEQALRKNPYLRAVNEVAAAVGAPLIDTITPFAERRTDWLFADFIHPNRDGHQLIADTIYRQLFTPPENSPMARLLSDRGVRPRATEK